MGQKDELSQFHDRAQAKVDAELAGVKAKHPSSDGLRKLADWLDQNGSNLVGPQFLGMQFVRPSPEALADFVRLTGAKVRKSGYSWVDVHTTIGGIPVSLSPRTETVAPIRKVMREVEEPDLSGFVS